MNAVPTGSGSEHDHRIALALSNSGGGAILPDYAQRHAVDDGIGAVTFVEDHLTGDGGDAQAVAVISDAAHHAVHQEAVAGDFQRAEVQRIQRSNGASSHGKNIAHDAAHAGGGALIGFDGARVVVRFDLEGDRQTVSDVHQTGVLFAGFFQRAGAGTGQLFQLGDGVLVAAVFGPHNREDTQLGVGGRTSQDFQDFLVFFFAQPVLEGEGEGDFSFGFHFGQDLLSIDP